jgi:type I restriction enzyme R subunit
VVDPKISFATLLSELATSSDAHVRELVLQQLIVKLRAKIRRMSDEGREGFVSATGAAPKAFLEQLRQQDASAAQVTLGKLPTLGAVLDAKLGTATPYMVSQHEDSFRGESRGYGVAERPEDYLDAFTRFVRENANKLPALIAVTQRPRELTREQLREIRLLLDQAQFRESWLQTAWRDKSNADIAATIIGFVRQAALGDPLVPYEQRVDRAVHKILASRPWTPQQRKWLERIGKALKNNVVIDRGTFDEGVYRDEGGFERFNKRFDGKLEEILGDLQEAVWAS